MEHMDEKIIREWIEKAKPLVDSAWNLAIDSCIHEIKEMFTPNHLTADQVINSLSKLKKHKA